MKSSEKSGLLKDLTSEYSATLRNGHSGRDSGYQEFDNEVDDIKTHKPTSSIITLQRQESEFDSYKTLSWKNLNVTATIEPPKQGCLQGCFSRCRKKPDQSLTTKPILRNVTGVAKAGSMVVIMGASGSGKTTLLNTLTGRNSDSLKVTGEILVNGKNIGDDINGMAGYIQQDDLFIGTLTVREHLQFNATLRMDKNLTEEQKTNRVDEVIKEMGLTKSQNTTIGVPGMVKGISGGEKKRLAFATELLTRPSILFSDEPTSGLDSFMAQAVVESMKRLTERGRTVVCTIHQPSSEVFAMFDQIIIVSEGRVAFMGPTDDLMKFFSDLGYNCPSNFNPADFFIQTLAIVPGRELECKEAVSKISDCYDESSYARSVQYQIEEQELIGNDKFVYDMYQIGGEKGDTMKRAARPDSSQSIYQASWWKQFTMCLWRSVMDIRRNKTVLPARVIQVVVAGVFLGSLYFQQDYTTTGVANINGALFMLMIQCSFNVSYTIATAFTKEFPVFLKENRDRTYSVSAYYLGKISTDLPIMIFAAFFYGTIAYWMIGLYPAPSNYIIAVCALIIIAMIGVSFGHLSAAIFPNPMLALTLLPFMLGISLLFSGFLLKEDSIPLVFKPFAWLSPYRYTYEILIINQWKDVTHLDCEFTEQASQLRLDGNFTTNYNSDNHQESSNWCYPNGMSVIWSYQYHLSDMYYLFAITIALFLGAEFFGYLALRSKGSKRKR